MLVIAIIGILTSVIVSINNMVYFQIKSDIQIIYSTLRKTRHIAIAESEDYDVELMSHNRLGIKKSSDSTYLKIIKIDNNVTFLCTRTSNQLKFTPLGTAVSGSFILRKGSYEKKVVVAGNGRIRIE